MTINTKVTINGTQRSDFKEITVERSMGDNNGTSKFKLVTDNFAGRHQDTYALNEEVIIYANKNAAPTTKIFTGIIENIDYEGSELNETLTISGRDYGAVLQDMTVQPTVQRDRDVGEIAKIIINNNAQNLVTTNNIDIATGVTIEMIAFNHKNIWDALQELADIAGYYFYVDENKDVHFIDKNSISSGYTFDSTNTTYANFTVDDSQIYNRVWVYGDRILTGATDTGGIADGGSIFTLTDKPSNTRVFVSSVLLQPGGVYEMSDPNEVKYLVNYNEKKIVFTSGTVWNNIPTSGTSNIQVDYERKTPILKFITDSTSVTNYGPKTKVITDSAIKSFNAANDRAVAFLAENKDAKIQGNLEINGIIDVVPGETVVANFPFHNIDSQTYQILSAEFKFNKKNNLTENVLRVTLNKKLPDFVDIMKAQMLRGQAYEAGPLEGTLSRLETTTGSIVHQVHYEVYTNAIGNNFVFHSNKHGRFEDANSAFGVGLLGSTLVTSGGDF
jgi:hypothetical protein